MHKFLKTHILEILLASIVLVACPKGGTPTAGTGTGITDTLIQTGVSVGVSTYLQHGISDPAKRVAIAKFGSGIAGSLRTVTKLEPPPTPAELTQVILSNIPQNLQNQYPEVVAFMVPLVISGYETALAHYGGGNQQQVYQILNDLATGVETGTACCLK